MKEEFLRLGEYGAAGLYEEPTRSLFYRKALGLRRYFEHCRLYVYSGEALYPSGTGYGGMMISPSYMHGLCLPPARLSEAAPLLAEKYQEEFDIYKSTVPREHILAGDMYTHAMPHYERILAEGLLSYIPRIERIADADMREGLLHLVEGIRCYVLRCVEYLTSVSADRALIEALESGEYKYLRVNFPNGDMVGHTGSFLATECSMEALDLQLARILKVVDKLQGVALITADHGNADEMYELDKKSGEPKKNKDGSLKAKTSHTLNPVPFIIYDNFYRDAYDVKLGREDFGLSDVAATTVNLLGFEAPEIWDESMISLK